jgi:hypothetical protein
MQFFARHSETIPLALMLKDNVPVNEPLDFIKCYALLRMRPLSISCAEGFVVNSCGKVDCDKSAQQED